MTNKSFLCNLCGSKEHKYLFSNYDRLYPEIGGVYDLYECINCGLIFVYPQPSKDELLNHYPAKYSVFNDEGDINHVRRIFTLIEGIYQILNLHRVKGSFNVLLFFLYPFKPFFRTIKFVENGNCLDIGCGNGYFLLLMKYLGMKPYGVEPGAFDDNLSKEYKLNIFEGDLFDANFKSNFFDLITLNHVLEHVDDPSYLLCEIKRILKNDGYVVIGVPITDSLAYNLFKDSWAQLDTPRHLYSFSTECLKNYGKSNGFQFVKLRYNSTPSFQFVSSIIYLFEKKLNKSLKRNLIHNLILNLILLPFAFFLNLLKKGDQCEIVLKLQE